VYEDSWLDRMVENQKNFVNTPYGSYSDSNRQNTKVTYSGAPDAPRAPWQKSRSSQVIRPEEKKAESFGAGDAVTHPIFGDGMILNAKKMSGDVLYEVAFDKVGTKKIMGNFAKMSRKEQ